MEFVGGSRGQLVLLAEDGTLQLWEIIENKAPDTVSSTPADVDSSSLSGDMIWTRVASTDVFVKETKDSSPKSPTTFCIKSDNSQILLGTTGGNVYILNLDTLEVLKDDSGDETIINNEVLLQNVPSEHKKSSQGSVEAIREQPSAPAKFLIGFQRGLLVLWDMEQKVAEHFYAASQVCKLLSSCCSYCMMDYLLSTNCMIDFLVMISIIAVQTNVCDEKM